MKTWERFSLFCNAERNARYRASLPVVEVDRREEWAAKYLGYWMDFFHPLWRTVDLFTDCYGEVVPVELLIKNMAFFKLPYSGQDIYIP